MSEQEFENQELQKLRRKYSTFAESEPSSSSSVAATASTFFNDGTRKVDFVLVYNRKDMLEIRGRMSVLLLYLDNVKAAGLQVEEERGRILTDLMCVKIHGPQAILQKYADTNLIPLAKDNPYYKYQEKIRSKCITNILTAPDPDDPLTQRAPLTLSGRQPTTFTNAERIMIVQKILSQAVFGYSPADKGFEALIKDQVILDAYPLHDSRYQFPVAGPLTDRQLLWKYWARFGNLFKKQPLNLIEQYYGSEVAFYFAWIEFYTMWLIPAAIFGSISFLIGLGLFFSERSLIINEVCKSNVRICPVCPSNTECSFINLSDSCYMFQLAYIIQNPSTIIFSLLLTFWGIIYVKIWNRKQVMLEMRWDLRNIPTTQTTRSDFLEVATVEKVSSVTGEKEYYLSIWQLIFYRGLALILFALFFCCFFVGVIGIMHFRLNIQYFGRRSKNTEFKRFLPMIEAMASTCLTILIMGFFNALIPIVCQKITSLEKHRFDSDYNNALMHKQIILSLANLLFPTVYLAFVKGHSYTHPGDESQWNFIGAFKADVCKQSGCFIDLSFQIFNLMLFTNGRRLFFQTILPFVQVHFNRLRVPRELFFSPTQWERDFTLVNVGKNFLYYEYIAIVLQFAYMMFFVVALPLGPLFAMINVILETRFDAMKILMRCRRIVPNKLVGLERWNSVMLTIVVLGTVSNSLLICFASNLIPRFVYQSRNQRSTVGFINSTLSAFAVADYADNVARILTTETTCYYLGKRNPPDHKDKYEHSADYWYHLAVQSIAFIVIEIVCIFFMLVMWCIIPDTPRKAQIKREFEEMTLRKARLKS